MPIIQPKGFEPGMYMMPNETYHADPAISSSQLVVACEKTMDHFWRQCSMNPDKVRQEETDALRLGSAIHCYLLERDSFDQRYLVLPEGTNLRTNEGKKLRDDLAERAKALGGNVLKYEEKQMIAEMAEALGRQEIDLETHIVTLKELFTIGKSEESFFWKDPTTGLMCRVRTDWRFKIPNFKRSILDFKSARDASPDAFGKQMATGYQWMRAAMYIDGVRAVTGEDYDYWVPGQEKEGGYCGIVGRYPEQLIEAGRELYVSKLIEIKQCMETGHWPGYTNKLVNLQVPDWLLKKHANVVAVLNGEQPPCYDPAAYASKN